MNAGLLPVKRLDRAKGRLAPHFDPEQRMAIACALLDDALELCASASFLRWWVMSDDVRVLRAAGDLGLSTARDEGRALNTALRHAIAAIADQGAASVTIIPVDVPLAAAADLEQIVEVGATSDVVVVPAARAGGTNGLHLRPPLIAQPRFGGASLAAHVELAARLRLRCSILRLPRLGVDIDTIDDVDAFLSDRARSNSRSAGVLRRLRRVHHAG